MKKFIAILSILATLTICGVYAAPIHISVENSGASIEATASAFAENSSLSADEYYYGVSSDVYILSGTQCFEFNEESSIVTGPVGTRGEYKSDSDGTKYLRYYAGQNTSYEWFNLTSGVDASKIKNVEIRLRANKTVTTDFVLSIPYDGAYTEHHESFSLTENTWHTFSYDYASAHPYSDKTTNVIQLLPTKLCNIADTELYIDYDYIRFTVETEFVHVGNNVFVIKGSECFEFNEANTVITGPVGSKGEYKSDSDGTKYLRYYAGQNTSFEWFKLSESVDASKIKNIEIRLRANKTITRKF